MIETLDIERVENRFINKPYILARNVMLVTVYIKREGRENGIERSLCYHRMAHNLINYL